MPHWLPVTAAVVAAGVRWMHMEVSWPLFLHPSCSTSCRQVRAPPLAHQLHPAHPRPPPTCSLEAIITCSRAHTTPFPSTIPTTCTDTTFRHHRAWLPAQRSLRVAYCALPHLPECLPNANTCPTAAWTVCT